MYRCEAKSVTEFIRQLAVNYISRGYVFYVKGEIPDAKNPVRTDAKIIEQYGIGISKWTRARRKRRGEAGVQYLRYGRQFVILATHGEHSFFFDEKEAIRDVRREPLQVAGFSIGYYERGQKWHVSVRIERAAFLNARTRIEAVAGGVSGDEAVEELKRLPFPFYAPVRKQLFMILRAVNRIRERQGLETIRSELLEWNQWDGRRTWHPPM